MQASHIYAGQEKQQLLLGQMKEWLWFVFVTVIKLHLEELFIAFFWFRSYLICSLCYMIALVTPSNFSKVFFNSKLLTCVLV